MAATAARPATGPLRVDPATGLLEGVHYQPSPNQDDRPEGMPVDLVVIHGISLPPDQFGGPWIEDLFLGRLDPTAHPFFEQLRDLRVSAHVLIRRSGAIAQYVPFHCKAWHAGESCWQGRERCNQFSVGIELEGSRHVPYESAQYESLARVLAAVTRVYPAITPDRVVGHSDVAPGRKSDPWQHFDWPRLHRLLAEHREGPAG
ncbi:MAG TPA: 1,6-anhydro-N-acetylmuramyl-L-alanine amidase AmpD [Thermoanaerobaculia bacterium]|nr:1,6-anhydro-N-acetylmuramyl-L-alanine amidase AmpD [Thermoanaerobaculia bacterium]